MPEQLAVNGGTPVRTTPFPGRRPYTEREEELVLEAIRSQNLFGKNGTFVPRLEEQYAAFCRWVERTHEDAVARALLDWDEDGHRCECGHPKCGDGILWCGCDICSEWYTDECYCRHWEETGDDWESWVP